VGALASLRAKGLVTAKDASDEAGATGYSADRLEALAADRQSYPGISELDKMSNRRVIDPDLIDKALSRHGIPAEYHAAVKALFSDLLSPGELAAAIHRGLIPDPGLLKGEQPSGPRNVESYPVYPIEAVKEAQGHGFDRDRLGVLVGLQGLPMGTIEAAHAYYRKIITRGDYIAAFNESNNRNEWAAAVLEYARQIPTARDFFENALRGYHSLEWAQEQAERHGMTPEDSLIIYQNQGRPMALKQITTALARGGVFKPEPGELTDPYMAAIVEGNVKPAYYDLALANRYTLPSAFAIRALMAGGSLTEKEGTTLLLQSGWEPTLAGKVAQVWAKGTKTAAKEATAADELTLYDGLRINRAELTKRLADLGYEAVEANRKADVLDARRVVSARTTGIAAARDAFVKHGATDADTATRLTQLGVHEWAQPLMIDAWRVARIAAAPDLSDAQIQRAYTRGNLSLHDATAALEARGWSADEAAVLLGIAAPTLTVKQVQDAYTNGLRTRDEAAALLAALGYSAADAALLLDEVRPDSDPGQIRTEYKAGTLDLTAATGLLVQLGYSPDAAAAFLAK
jgi:hypothetical protein